MGRNRLVFRIATNFINLFFAVCPAEAQELNENSPEKDFQNSLRIHTDYFVVGSFHNAPKSQIGLSYERIVKNRFGAGTEFHFWNRYSSGDAYVVIFYPYDIYDNEKWKLYCRTSTKMIDLFGFKEFSLTRNNKLCARIKSGLSYAVGNATFVRRTIWSHPVDPPSHPVWHEQNTLVSHYWGGLTGGSITYSFFNNVFGISISCGIRYYKFLLPQYEWGGAIVINF